jgi:uncharacterized protein (TIGR02284 family)
MDAIEDKLLVAALNRCIEVCIDAERAYAIAAATAREPSLKSFLRAQCNERADFVQRLQRAVGDLGAWPENEGTTKGALRRRFMDIERGLEPWHDDRRVLADALREERAARDAYERALPAARADEMPIDVRIMLREQRASMENASDELARRLASAPRHDGARRESRAPNT